MVRSCAAAGGVRRGAVPSRWCRACRDPTPGRRPSREGASLPGVPRVMPVTAYVAPPLTLRPPPTPAVRQPSRAATLVVVRCEEGA